MSFALHPQLEKDTILIGNLPLCRVLLMNNQHFPWLILVPRRDNIREIFELTPQDYQTAMAETRHIAEAFCALHRAHKMNIAMLGNMVPQLHIHIIARFEGDAAWPKPVWNTVSKPYGADQLPKTLAALQKTLNL
jgi:diadenosine tetraphosphate (Ap4A) HIT family hydrolase